MTDAVNSLAFAKSLSLGGEATGRTKKSQAMSVPEGLQTIVARALRPHATKEDLFRAFSCACKEGNITSAKLLIKKARQERLSHEIVNQKGSAGINPLVFNIAECAS